MLRKIHPEDLHAPDEMLPALVVHAHIEDVEHILHAKAFVPPESEERVVLMEVDAGVANSAQVALISYDQEPQYVHLFVADSELGNRPGEQLHKIVRRLKLQSFTINWWTRRADESWPGNRQADFSLSEAQGGAA